MRKMSFRKKTKDAGTCTSEDGMPVPMELAGPPSTDSPPSISPPAVPPPAVPPPSVPPPAVQPPAVPPPLQPPLPPQVMVPQPPILLPPNYPVIRPPRYLQQPINENTIIMSMYRGLKHLNGLIKEMQDDTEKHIREQFHPTVEINSTGMSTYVEPTVVALYVVETTETKKCSNCNHTTESACGSCRQAPYCSGYCLQKGWDTHEPRCNLVIAATAQAATEALLRA